MNAEERYKTIFQRFNKAYEEAYRENNKRISALNAHIKVIEMVERRGYKGDPRLN